MQRLNAHLRDAFAHAGAAHQASALHAAIDTKRPSFTFEAGLVTAEDVQRLAKDVGLRKAGDAVLSSLAHFTGGTLPEPRFGMSEDGKDPASTGDGLPGVFGLQLPACDPDEAASFVTYASHGAGIFTEVGDMTGLGTMLRMLAVAQITQGQYDDALKHAKQSLDVFKVLKDRTGVLSALTTIVIAHGTSEPIDSARMLEVASEGVAFFKGLDDKPGAAGALRLVAAVQYATFARKGEPKEARRAAEAAIALYRNLQDKDGQVAVLHTAVYASLSKGQPDEALRAAKDLLSLHQAVGDQTEVARALDILANVHLAKDNARKALKVAQEALSIMTSVGSAIAELDVLRTLASVYFVKRDGDGALTAAQDMLALFQKLSDGPGEASAMVLIFRVYQLAGLDDEALKMAYDALSVMRALGDKRGQLWVIELICVALQQKNAFGEVLEVAQDALSLTQELQLRFSEGCAMFMIAQVNIASEEGLSCASQAAQIFREIDHKKEAATALHAVANGCLLLRAPARDALTAAGEGLQLYQELQDKQGEAIMMHTIANCQLALRETDNAVNTAYEAARMFEKIGDSYGLRLAWKLLLGAGQTKEEIQERREQMSSTFDGPEKKVSAETDEERRRQEDEAHDLQQQQVLWELAWIPWETQDPKSFGEKHDGGTRKIFVASELQDKGLLKKLMQCRPTKSAPSGGTPFFSNVLNGRLLNKDTLQFGMRACSAMSVIYDVSKLNHHGALEVIDLVLKLVQAFVPIDERKVSLDVVTTSCHNLAYTAGLREPFHGTLWGFTRTARNENPMHEFRVLDLDGARRAENMAFVCRYLLGAQTTRPAEAIVRNGGLLVSRLVGARSKLNLPFRIELEAR